MVGARACIPPRLSGRRVELSAILRLVDRLQESALVPVECQGERARRGACTSPLRSRKDRGFGSRETRPLVRRTRGQPADRDALYRMIPSNAFLLSAALMVLSVGHYFWRRVR